MMLLPFRPCAARPLRELPPRVFPKTPDLPRPLCARDDEHNPLYQVPIVGPTDMEVSYLITVNRAPRQRVRSSVVARVPVNAWTQADLEALIREVFSAYETVCTEYRIRASSAGRHLIEACGDEPGHCPRAGMAHDMYLRFLAPLSVALCRELISTTNQFQISCRLRVETAPAAIAPQGGAR